MNEIPKIDDGGPAFPQHVAPAYRQEPAIWGMTLRDYFAAKAMQGMYSCPDFSPPHPDGKPIYTDQKPEDAQRRLAEAMGFQAYVIADAMIAQRKG